METQAKLAVLRTYVDNQAVLEPILPHLASKYKQTQKQSIRVVYGPTFLPLGEIFISFFSLLGQDVIKPESNSVIIACDLSQKHKLAPFHTSERSKANIL